MTFLSALLPYARPPDSAVSGRRFVDSIFAGVGRFVNYIFPMGWRFVTLIVRGKGWRFVNLIFGRVDLLIRFSKGSGVAVGAEGPREREAAFPRRRQLPVLRTKNNQREPAPLFFVK